MADKKQEVLEQRVQELTTKTVEPLPADSDLVRPYESVKVYSTGKTKHSKAGVEMDVHPLLAEKLVSAGKATKDKPKEK